MVDYYILQHLVREFQILKDSVVVECFTQERNSLYLQFYNGDVLKTLQFCSEPSLESIFLRKDFAKARSNFKDLFPELLGNKCFEVKLLQGERLVVFAFDKLSLWFVLFGGSKTNCFLVDNDTNIIGSFLRPKEFVGKSINSILQVRTKSAPETLQKYLQQVKFFSKETAKYVCKKLNLTCDTKFESLSNEIKEQIENISEQIAKEMVSTKEFYVFFHNHKYFVSLLLLDNYILTSKFDSISEAVRYCFVQSIIYCQAKERYKELEQKLLKEYKYFKKELEDFSKQKEIEKKINEYQNYADLLISQPDLFKKGLDEIILSDFEGKPLRIPLKSELNLRENAELYYKKIKKLKSSMASLPKKLEVVQNRLSKIEVAIENLHKISNYLKIKEFEKQFQDIIKEVEPTEETNEQPQKFRKFKIEDGAILYVGKNAKNNEELTFGFANPNDFWFHAREVGGSHCVLKYSKGKEPPREIIEKAAEIAAYFSKARNSEFAPVSFTQRKYIRKPKRIEKGTVTLMREEVIFVKPKKPEDYLGD